ncbi:MAG TPA: hypothetical protein VI585_15630 [Candidatus Binatia bacterium]
MEFRTRLSNKAYLATVRLATANQRAVLGRPGTGVLIALPNLWYNNFPGFLSGSSM